MRASECEIVRVRVSEERERMRDCLLTSVYISKGVRAIVCVRVRGFQIDKRKS